jgi:hypothetical protein
MTTITDPRALPHKDIPTPEDISTVSQVIEVVRRSNHATSFAGWTVTTIAVGLVIQVDTLLSIESFPVTVALIGLLIPVLAATVRTGILLVSAGRAVSVVGGDGEPTGAAADTGQPDTGEERAYRQVWDRLRSAITSTQVRDARARRALVWAYGAGAAFLSWSLAVVLLASQ